MTKNLKKCYHFMNLRYDAGVQEVEVRKQMMLEKLQNAQNKKADANIKKINLCTEAILTNLALNGTPTDKVLFDTSIENLGSMFSTVFIIFAFAVITFCLMI